MVGGVAANKLSAKIRKKKILYKRKREGDDSIENKPPPPPIIPNGFFSDSFQLGWPAGRLVNGHRDGFVLRGYVCIHVVCLVV